ncbi:MAG: LutB/LldF family L-lactate oxidation iron-sulfur protein [Chloroflexota bacterium]
MEIKSNQFVQSADEALNDPDLQEAVSYGTRLGFEKRVGAMYEFGREHGEALRQQSAGIKRRTLANLPELIVQAEGNLLRNDFKVFWAKDADEANQLIIEIAENHQVKLAVKSKSMATEEIGLNDNLEAAGIEVVETDLGEFIVQLAEERPSHIVVPIVHKTKQSIQKTLEDKAGMPPTDDPLEMTRFARAYLREKFFKADLGISGANFVIAETGSIGLVMNEGNGRLVTSLPKVHIVLVGIEKIVATIDEYATLTQVLPRSATGQTLTVYTNLINGPKRKHEPDGPEDIYVIFLDNGRSDIYQSNYVESLACIRCGSCLNACPVYDVTGGHAYGWVYPGPIGSVITPLLKGLENAHTLPYACSLCGLCKDVCPVDIDLPHFLLNLRKDVVETQSGNWIWNMGISGWAWIMRHPRIYRWGSKGAGWILSLLQIKKLPGPLSGWTDHRDVPTFAKRSFTELWADYKGGVDG